ncbi:MAG: cyclodeaminase/cyclohydrolase family protein [Geodermatophilaceae bacterium]|nr:cyclodeaminase/cyclohydrolase family protein [Geodermatophilaceae bacterium]
MSGAPGDLLQLRVGELLDSVAARTPAPGGGAVAAVVTALAAGLIAMAGRFADPSKIPPGLVDRAEALRAHAGPLADADAATYGRYLEATRRRDESDPASRAEAVSRALSEATDVPLSILQTAAEVADLGRQLLLDGNPRLHGDAAAGVLLAAAAAEAAALLVAENLADSPADPRARRAAVLAAGTRALAVAVHPGTGPRA